MLVNTWKAVQLMQHSSISNVAERQFLIIFIGFYDFMASDILIDSRINFKKEYKKYNKN